MIIYARIKKYTEQLIDIQGRRAVRPSDYALPDTGRMTMAHDTRELVIDAKTDNLPQVMEFVDCLLEELQCPMRTQMQVDIAVEEIFVNIAHYAYTPDTGLARILVEIREDPVEIRITFEDQGIPYNPLAREDPDVTLSAEKRKIGGLGIFMTKKAMDDVCYEYRDNKNLLTIIKRI